MMKCGHEDRAMDSIYTCAECFDAKDKRIAELEGLLASAQLQTRVDNEAIGSLRAGLKEARKRIDVLDRANDLGKENWSKKYNEMKEICKQLVADVERKSEALKDIIGVCGVFRGTDSDIVRMQNIAKEAIKPRELTHTE